MARKRRALEGIDYQSPEYWERLLAAEGLSMEAGRSKRVSYVGGTSTLDALAGAQEMGTRSTEGDVDISYPKNSTESDSPN